MRRTFLISVMVLVLGLPTLGRTATWEIDTNHTSAQFAIRHLMVSTVRGNFPKVTGTVNLDEQDVTKSTIEATIDVASVNTGIEKRDDHLRSPDFFNVAQYPHITFKSKKVEKAGDDKLKITGDFTLHGVTKEIVLDYEGSLTPIKDPMGKTRLGGMATTKIKRSDFGLTWNRALETGGVTVGDEVSIILDIELTQAGATAAATPASAATAVKQAADQAIDKAVDTVADKALDAAAGQ
ncbi:MAG: YceI family protein [Candidatus Binatia bacterium]